MIPTLPQATIKLVTGYDSLDASTRGEVDIGFPVIAITLAGAVKLATVSH